MEVNRVVYKKNPLVEVVCQLNYPRALIIDDALPAEFQNKIKHLYPFLSISTISDFQFQIDANTVLAQQFKQQSRNMQVYNFLSSDQQWSVALCSEYVLVRTSGYERWELFQDRISTVIDIMNEVYGIKDFSRIGLRYIDFIERQSLGLEDVQWPDLVNSFALGGIPVFDGEGVPLEYHANHLFEFETCKVRLQFALGQRSQDNKMGFVIDGDYFHEATTGELIDDPLRVLDSFRPIPYRIFRNCIKDRLHEAMEPSSI